jgi:hypothetical protein
MFAAPDDASPNPVSAVHAPRPGPGPAKAADEENVFYGVWDRKA